MDHVEHVALFRYERIAPRLDKSLSPPERRAELGLCTRTPVLWPNGDERPVSRATLYRWIALYKEGNLPALRPRPVPTGGRPVRTAPAGSDAPCSSSSSGPAVR